jgi:hypothetical protein
MKKAFVPDPMSVKALVGSLHGEIVTKAQAIALLQVRRGVNLKPQSVGVVLSLLAKEKKATRISLGVYRIL